MVALAHPQDPAIERAVQEVIDAFRKQFNKSQVVHLSAPLVIARFYTD